MEGFDKNVIDDGFFEGRFDDTIRQLGLNDGNETVEKFLWDMAKQIRVCLMSDFGKNTQVHGAKQMRNNNHRFLLFDNDWAITERTEKPYPLKYLTGEVVRLKSMSKRKAVYRARLIMPKSFSVLAKLEEEVRELTVSLFSLDSAANFEVVTDWDFDSVGQVGYYVHYKIFPNKAAAKIGYK